MPGLVAALFERYTIPMKRLLIIAVLLGAVSQSTYASMPLVGCQMTMTMPCCSMKDCGDCHMKQSTTERDQEAVQSAYVRASFSQVVLQRQNAAVVSPVPGTLKPQRKNPSAFSESPGDLYDLYSDYRL